MAEPFEPKPSPLFRAPLGQVGCLVGVLLLGFFLLFGPQVEASRGGARFFQCRNNLKQIEIALSNYHDEYGRFPPAVTRGPDGTPWHSWRVLLLPFVEQGPLFKRYRLDEPWNGPHNAALAASVEMPQMYYCPADEKARDARWTSYLAVVGAGTLWPPDGSASHGDVADAAGETIQVVERSDSGIHWMEPRDLAFDRMSFAVGAGTGDGIRSHHHGEERWLRPDGPPRSNVGFADGTRRTLETTADPAAVRSMLLRADGKPPRE